MRARPAAICALLLILGTRASAHRLDEYLQATTLSVEKRRIQAQIRLTPGVAVFSQVFAAIDTDRNGVLSETEERSYAEQVLHDLSLKVDGEPLPLHLNTWKFAKTAEMQAGRGEIQIDFSADVAGRGANRSLQFENHHRSSIAVYLVNCLVPTDPDIQVTAQHRDYLQSSYQLNYVQVDRHLTPSTATKRSALPAWLGAAALFACIGLAIRLRRRALPQSADRNVTAARSAEGNVL